MDEYGGGWITTYTGKKFHYRNPAVDEIYIEDIAHQLSLTCRFTGACKEFYSVAEHSIRVAEIVPQKDKLLALLHDGSDAYLTDLPRPIKADLPKFKEMEAGILAKIWLKFLGRIPYGKDLAIVKEADDILLATEARDLMANMDDWASLPEPLLEKIEPLNSKDAERIFLCRFYREFLCPPTAFWDTQITAR